MISRYGDRPWWREIFFHIAQGIEAENMITGYESSSNSMGIYTPLQWALWAQKNRLDCDLPSLLFGEVIDYRVVLCNAVGEVVWAKGPKVT